MFSDSFSYVTFGTIPNSQEIATGYNGLMVTAFIENLKLNEDCYWINTRYYFFAGQNDGCDPFICTPPDFNISCQKAGVDQFYSNLTFLEPLINKSFALSVECEFSSRYDLRITVKGKTIFLLTYNMFFCRYLCVNSNSASTT